MASDKLMNHTQGETIITKLTAIADSLDDLAAVTPAKLGMGIATCDTAASTAAKTAALANFALVEGAPVSVKFTYANTATNATLNINNTGAKPIIYKDAAIGNDVISAGDTCTFIYTTNTYKITNIDTLTGPGSGTVRQVGAENGLITDQNGNADIQTTGNIGLNLKSTTKHANSVGNPEDTDQIYPVQLDKDGVPCVAVPWIEYTQGDGINISENNVITNTGVFDVTTPTSSDISATNGDIKVTKKVVNNGVTSDSVTFVKPKGINDPAFKALDSSTSGLTADDNHVPTSKTVQDAIDTALASASVYKGTIAAFNDLPTSTATVIVRKGWYYRVSTAWAATTGTPATHVGDIIIAEKDSPSKSIDGTNWSLLHNEANTDANVAQSPVSTNANYEVLFSGSADNTAHTEGTGKDSGLTYNPSTNKLTVSGEVSGTGFTGDGVKTSFASQTSDLSDKKVPSEKLVKTSLDEKVAGPSSVTGDTIVLFDSTTGKLIKSSSKTFESSYSISDDDTKIPTSKGIRENAATYGKLGTYSADTSRTNITNNTTIKGAVKQLEYREELNKSNILYALGKTGRNHFNLDMSVVKNWNIAGTWNGNVYTQGGLTFTFNSDGTIDVSGTATERVNVVLDVYYPLNTEIGYRFHDLDGLVLSGCPTGGAWNRYSLSLQMTDSPWAGSAIDTGSGATINNSALPSCTTVAFYLTIYASYPTSSFTFKPMFCTQEDWSISHDYTPYQGRPNYDLTRLESEDRAGLIECVDGGAKNKVNIVSPTATIGNITFTHNSDGSITVNGTANNTDTFYYLTSTTGNSGQSAVMNVGSNPCILTGCPSGGAGNTYELQLATNSGDYRDRGTGIDIPANSSGSVVIAIRAGYAPSNLKFYPMICTKAAFGVSPKFVPFGNDPFYQAPINHNMIYRGRNLGATLTDAQHTALSSGNFTDLYLGDYWTKTVTVPAGTYTGGDGEEVTVPAQTNITLKAVIADFDTFYAGYASSYAGINTHHAAVIVTGFSNVVWNKTNSTTGGYVASLIHKWLVGSALPQIETWFGSAKVLSHQKLLTNAITGDAASGWEWSSQKISLLSENQMYGSKVWGNSKASNGGYEPGEAFKHLNVFNHIDANLLFGNKNIWLRDIASAVGAADLGSGGLANYDAASRAWIAPAALILLS